MSLQFGDFELDRERRQLLRSGRPVPLEPKAYELLSLLVERRPRALSRAQIRDVVWPGVFISESTLGVAVNAIRQALGDDARQPRFVRTVHGFGYAFCGEAGDEAIGRAESGEAGGGPQPLSGTPSFTRRRTPGSSWARGRGRGAVGETPAPRLLALIGPSGAGKTSFVRAGVLPGRPERWGAIVSAPGRARCRAWPRRWPPKSQGTRRR